MKLRLRLLMPLLTFARTSFGQGSNSTAASAPQKQASQPSTLAAVVDRDISAIENQILDVAEDMAEDKFNFSPDSLHIAGADYRGVRTFAVQLTHRRFQLLHMVADYRRQTTGGLGGRK
jgi:hypothetical protein